MSILIAINLINDYKIAIFIEYYYCYYHFKKYAMLRTKEIVYEKKQITFIYFY